MKHDQNKPDGLEFYWDGLEKLVPSYQEYIIADYRNFAKNPTMHTLQILWDGILLENISDEEITALMHIYSHGAKLYGDKNYLGLELQRIVTAMKRHLIKWCCGVHLDKDSGYQHFSHVLANILIAAELLM